MNTNMDLNLDAEDESDKYNWQLYYKFEEVIYKGSDSEIKKYWLNSMNRIF